MALSREAFARKKVNRLWCCWEQRFPSFSLPWVCTSIIPLHPTPAHSLTSLTIPTGATFAFDSHKLNFHNFTFWTWILSVCLPSCHFAREFFQFLHAVPVPLPASMVITFYGNSPFSLSHRTQVHLSCEFFSPHFFPITNSYIAAKKDEKSFSLFIYSHHSSPGRQQQQNIMWKINLKSKAGQLWAIAGKYYLHKTRNEKFH